MGKASGTVTVMETELALAIAQGMARARVDRAVRMLAAEVPTAAEFDQAMADLMAAAVFASRARALAAALAALRAGDPVRLKAEVAAADGSAATMAARGRLAKARTASSARRIDAAALAAAREQASLETAAAAVCEPEREGSAAAADDGAA